MLDKSIDINNIMTEQKYVSPPMKTFDTSMLSSKAKTQYIQRMK